VGDAAVKYDSKGPKSFNTFTMLQSTVGAMDELSFSVRLLMSGNQFPIKLTIDFKTSKTWALKKLLKHRRVKYKNPAVLIHENGNLARILS